MLLLLGVKVSLLHRRPEKILFLNDLDSLLSFLLLVKHEPLTVKVV